MSKPKLIIIGASGHAKVIIDVFEKMDSHELIGLLDDNVPTNSIVLGKIVIGKIANLDEYLVNDKNVEVFIAIGDNWIRHKIKEQLTETYPSLRWAQAIHPFTSIGKGVTLGKGIAIAAGAVINSDAEIGDFTIVGSNSTVDHECQLGDFVSLAPGSSLGGNVSIGRYSTVGIGANIIHGSQIGGHTVIGAGSTVLNDFNDKLVVYGSPAREIRSRNPGDKYL